MKDDIPVWRVEEGSLRPSGRISSSSKWLLDDEVQNAADELCSISGLLSQARLHRQSENEYRKRASAAAAAAAAAVQACGGGGSSGGSLFQTGTGKSVQVSNASMKRALALLGEGASNAALSAAPTIKRANVGGEQSLFQTATGRAVPISASAMNKARAILQENHSEDLQKTGFFSTAGNLRKGPASAPPFKQPRRRFTSPMTPATINGALQQKVVTPTPISSTLSEVQLRLFTPVAKEKLLEDVIPRGKTLRMPLRVSLRQFFQHPPRRNVEDLLSVAKEIRSMTSDSARDFKFEKQGIGPLELRSMLLEAGAKPHLATNEWVENHYRWIVWKLASQQRSYPQKAAGFLTLNNVFVELKYRYRREVGFGQRSIIKKICEKDASPTKTMVLCVSAIRKRPIFDQHGELTQAARIEVTDGWYCLNALLDVPLSKQLQAGKLFVGQKLQISEAHLYGTDEGLPPLEAYNVSNLALHTNGTYRAHWADRLGTCKCRSPPLAFKCIKPDGGSVPSVCVGVNRIYPFLYRERLEGGISVVRNARAEHSAQTSYEQRRAGVIEDVVSRLEKQEPSAEPDDSLEEGARLFRSLECAADPEVVMADMTAEDHAALSGYQSKLKLRRQATAEKLVQKALEDAHLHKRDVTRFLKLGVSGLQRNAQSCAKDGFVTIWDPSDSLIDELVEGGTYVVCGLKPASASQAGSLHLSANKSSKWRKLSCELLKFRFRPRVAIQLPSLVDVPAYSEFDVAALVLHVGDVYASGSRKRQWIFVSDGSLLERGQVALLAIDVSASVESFSAFESAYSGSVVGFCNLLKVLPDEKNCMWVAEASNLTIYSSKLSSKTYLHLCKPAALVTRWARSSPQLIACLEHRILDILSDEA